MIVEGDTVFVTTGLSELLALSAADGSVKWRVRLSAPMRGAPSFANGRVFVTTLDSTLLALSAEEGKVLWRYRAQAILTVPLGLPPPELGLGLAPLRHIAPRPGRLAIFPSTTWHGTIPFAGEERLTIAFDIAPQEPGNLTHHG